MRRLLLVALLLTPLAVAAYHYGPGQEKLALDRVDGLLSQGDRLAREERWADAAKKYDAALEALPADYVDQTRRIRVERAKANMQIGKLPEAYDDLTMLADEQLADPKCDQAIYRDTRTALADAKYYLTWLMRLEGLPREEWEPEIESARQTFVSLVEEAKDAGDEDFAKLRQEDLEATVRLARMDLTELQGAPLPCQCKGCCSGTCKKPGMKKGGGKQKPKDARGASSGPPADGGGS